MKPNKSTISPFSPKSFTYYLPAPPKRKTGYREKQFDKIFNSILSLGFAVETVNTVSHSSDNGNGMWLHFLLRPLNSQAAALDLDVLLAADDESTTVEGLYPLGPI